MHAGFLVAQKCSRWYDRSMPDNRAVTYLRVSTEEQGTRFGLPSQRAACQGRAKEKGWTIIREIVDDQTGTDVFRPGLAEVRRLSAAGEVDIVLMYSVDRLSRTTIDALTLTAELRQHAQIHYVMDVFEDTPQGQFFLEMKAAMGALDRSVILQRTQAGRMAKARSGLVPGGRAPFGYRIDDGRYVIQDEEAAVVRQVYDWAAAGVSQRDIARRLNEAGTKPYMAAKWGKTSVGRIIGHEVYIGTAVYNARKRKKTILRPRPVAEHIEIPVPPIISREVYETVVVARAMNREMLVGRPSRDYMLTSILRCSCSKRMCGDGGLYRCIRRESKDAAQLECKTSVSAAFLDELIWDFFVDYFADPEKLRKDVQRDMEVNRSKWESASGVRESLAGRIEKLAAREKRMLDLMVEMDIADDRKALKVKRDEARAERLRLQAQLKAMSPVPVMLDADAIARRIHDDVVSKTTTKDRRKLLREMHVELYWDGKGLRLKYRVAELPPGPADDGVTLPITQRETEAHSDNPTRPGNCPACSHDWPSRLRQDHARQAPRRHPAAAHLRGGHRNHQGPQHRRNPGTRRRASPRAPLPFSPPHHLRRGLDRRWRRHATPRRGQPGAQWHALPRRVP